MKAVDASGVLYHQRWLVEEDGVVDDITAVVVRFLQPG